MVIQSVGFDSANRFAISPACSLRFCPKMSRPAADPKALEEMVLIYSLEDALARGNAVEVQALLDEFNKRGISFALRPDLKLVCDPFPAFPCFKHIPSLLCSGFITLQSGA